MHTVQVVHVYQVQVRLRPDTCMHTILVLHHFYQHEYKIKIFKLYTKEREPTDCPSHCFVM